MTDNNQNADRDEVLFAFHQECTRPTAKDISTWVSKYPQFAEDIWTHAAIARDWDARQEEAAEVSDAMLRHGYSRALSALYSAELDVETTDVSVQQSFDELMAERNKTVPDLAREIDIKRSVIADLFGGRVRPPIGQRLNQALMSSLSISSAILGGAIHHALGAPSMGMAKANGITAITPRTYEDVIKTSGMTPERIRYWLDED